MRLTERELRILRKVFSEFFGETDHLWLFGSRADDTKRGGDIDLYIETMNANQDALFKQKLNFTVALKRQLGDQKIDVVINSVPYQQELPIFQIAKATGKQII